MRAAGRQASSSRAAWSPPVTAAGRPVPGWGVLAAAAGLVLLVAGCAVATGLQPASFDWVTSTVSALTERQAADPWVMTAAFAVTGVCEIVTALALRPARLPGRLLLAAAGAASVLVAAHPERAGGSLAHGVWAAVTFGALLAWPAAAWRRGSLVPWGLRPAVSAVATGTLGTLLAWFLVELTSHGSLTGLAERIMGVALVGWPLAVALSARRVARRAGALLETCICQPARRRPSGWAPPSGCRAPSATSAPWPTAPGGLRGRPHPVAPPGGRRNANPDRIQTAP